MPVLKKAPEQICPVCSKDLSLSYLSGVRVAQHVKPLTMTAQDALPHLSNIAATGTRHALYARTVAIADECRVLLGDTKAQAEKLREYTLMETKEEQEQRQRLTNAITGATLGPSLSYLEKVIRADGQTEIIEGPPEIRSKLTDHFTRFYRGETLKQYCFEAAKYAVKLDPNYWTVFQYKTNTENGGTTITDIYPIEVSSKSALDWGFDEAGELSYLCFTSDRPVINKGKPATAPEYFCYGIGYVLHLLEVRPEWEEVNTYDGYATTVYTQPNGKTMSFAYRIFTNGTKEVPAIRWAAYLSDLDDNEIGVPIYQNARGHLFDLIRDKSFFDLTKVLHMRPEKAQYVKTCDGMDEKGDQMCDGGYYGGIRKEENRCHQCNGSGKMLAASEQRVVTLAWPERSEDVLDLGKLAHYFDRPVDSIRFFDQQIAAATRAVTLAVFNQQNVDAGALSSPTTATASRIEYDKVNDKLAPFAAQIEKAFEKAWRVGFNFYGQEAKVALLSFPSDYKLQSLMELMNDLKSARDSGSPYWVTQSIMMDMLSKSYRNSPDMVALFAAIERHRPMKSKRPEEAAMLLQLRAPDDPERQLFEQWDNVINEIQETQPAFFVYTLEQQRRMMYEMAAKYAENVKYIDNSPGLEGGLESLFAQLAGEGQEPPLEPGQV